MILTLEMLLRRTNSVKLRENSSVEAIQNKKPPDYREAFFIEFELQLIITL